MIDYVNFSKHFNEIGIKVTIVRLFEFLYVISTNIPDISLYACWNV